MGDEPLRVPAGEPRLPGPAGFSSPLLWSGTPGAIGGERASHGAAGCDARWTMEVHGNSTYLTVYKKGCPMLLRHLHFSLSRHTVVKLCISLRLKAKIWLGSVALSTNKLSDSGVVATAFPGLCGTRGTVRGIAALKSSKAGGWPPQAQNEQGHG